MSFLLRENKGVPILESSLLADRPVIHGFTTRLGGVSTGECGSLNLGLNRRDNPANVRENYRRVAKAMGVSPESYVFVKATHGVRIYRANAYDRHENRWWQGMPEGYDGVITDTPGLTLLMRVADCIPLLLYDVKNHAAGIVHCGWRGVLGGAAGNAVREMQAAYGTLPENLLAVIGPHICSDCYQVHEDVYAYFLPLPGAVGESGYAPNGKERRSLHLARCLQNQLWELGVKPENTDCVSLCTCEDRRFYSQRRMGEKRGNQIGLICLG